MKKHIPNFLTCCNLLCGTLGILNIFDFPYLIEEVEYKGVLPAAYFVWAACTFDFFDGFAARILKVSSPIGKELDSLADMISFGLLPSVVVYNMLQAAGAPGVVPYFAFSIAVFSALRLAIFNLDERQSDSFRGLPTPANALLISALPLLTGSVAGLLQEVWVLVVLTFLSSYLLVSGIELFALKFKNFSWPDNKIRFTFLALSVLLLVALQSAAIPV